MIISEDYVYLPRVPPPPKGGLDQMLRFSLYITEL